jgi:hypothetical protein
LVEGSALAGWFGIDAGIRQGSVELTLPDALERSFYESKSLTSQARLMVLETNGSTSSADTAAMKSTLESIDVSIFSSFPVVHSCWKQRSGKKTQPAPLMAMDAATSMLVQRTW